MSARSSNDQQVLPLVALVQRQVNASGLTLREFSRVRGISYGTLRRYYSKRMEPLEQGLKPDTSKALAAALDVPLSEVLKAADASRRSDLYQRRLTSGVTAFLLGASELTEQEIEATVVGLQRLLDDKRGEGGGS